MMADLSFTSVESIYSPPCYLQPTSLDELLMRMNDPGPQGYGVLEQFIMDVRNFLNVRIATIPQEDAATRAAVMALAQQLDLIVRQAQTQVMQQQQQQAMAQAGQGYPQVPPQVA